ncbi:fasciclin domain-containing protein [Zhengella mangrovi]|uniref:fasciclin domain-containing protein n=1 Tax=Zhengella mangrovi TaxID=1982044 RepID=UPI0013FE0F0F|nr:fasciclin domain-containing protein [Zhengella mangrovi]
MSRLFRLIVPVAAVLFSTMTLAAAAQGTVTTGTAATTDAGSIEAPVGDGEDALPEATRSVLDILSSEPRFSLFRTLVDLAGTPDVFTEGGPITVFVPTDDVLASAFEAYMKGFKGKAYDKRVRKLVLAHVLDAQFSPDDLIANITHSRRRRDNMGTVSGDNVTLTIVGEQICVFDESAQVLPVSLVETGTDGTVYALETGMIRPR